MNNTTHTFAFSLGQQVRIKSSGETGEVRGLAVNAGMTDQARIHYKAADSRATEAWWDIELLEAC